MRSLIVSILVVLVLAGSYVVLSNELSVTVDDGITSKLAEAVRTEYDGEKALETVAFLDNYVRWPGNSGFDAALDHVVDRLAAALRQGYLLRLVLPWRAFADRQRA